MSGGSTAAEPVTCVTWLDSGGEFPVVGTCTSEVDLARCHLARYLVGLTCVSMHLAASVRSFFKKSPLDHWSFFPSLVNPVFDHCSTSYILYHACTWVPPDLCPIEFAVMDFRAILACHVAAVLVLLVCARMTCQTHRLAASSLSCRSRACDCGAPGRVSYAVLRGPCG